MSKDDPKLPITLEDFERSAEIARNRPHDKRLRKLAQSRLSVRYEENGTWGIAYKLPDGGTIPISSKYPAEQVCAQLRGVLENFALTCAEEIEERQR